MSQSDLADRLRGVTALAYLNRFAETSCISVMEALAAGCLVVSSRLGALPETTGEFGILAPVVDRNIDPQAYVNAAGAIVDAFAQNNPALDARLRLQVDWVNRVYRWSARAEQAEALIGGIA